MASKKLTSKEAEIIRRAYRDGLTIADIMLILKEAAGVRMHRNTVRTYATATHPEKSQYQVEWFRARHGR